MYDNQKDSQLIHLALDMTNLSSGGSISILLRYMEQWNSFGIKMTVFYVRDTIGNEIKAANLPVTLVQIGSGWPSWKIFLYRNFRLYKVICDSGAQILYCVNSMLLRCPIPQIVHMRNLQHFNSKSFLGQLLTGGIYEALRDYMCRYSVRHAQSSVFISNYLQKAAIKTCPSANPDGFKVIYNPISSEMLDSVKTPEIISNYDNSIVLGVFNDYPHKDTPAFLRTLSNLHKSAPERNWQGIIIGNGDWSKYDSLISELHLQGSIAFPGYVPSAETSRFYKKAFCLLSTSKLEAFNNTPLESMAYSCPVVITSCCAHPEVVEDAGLFFPPGDPDAATDCILRLYRDKKLYEDFVHRGRLNLRRFLPEDSARAFYELFKKSYKTISQ